MRIRFLFIFSLAVASLFCGQTVAKDSSGLMIGIKSDCIEYGLQDRITISVALKNQNAPPLVLYSRLGWGELGGLILRISRMDGELIHQGNVDHDMIVPSTLQDRMYYSTLFSNQFIGVSRTERISELFPGPGQYKIWVEYLSPVAAESSLIKESFWSMEKGRLSSGVKILMIAQGGKCSYRR